MDQSHSIPALLARRAQAQPEHVAFAGPAFDGLTVARWHARSCALARGLVAGGLRSGDRVGLVFGNEQWCDYAIAYAAVQAAGAVAVPLNAKLPAARVAQALAHCGASLTLGAADLSTWDGGDTREIDLSTPDGPAQIIYTSGTTGTPKGVTATHSNLVHGLAELAHSRHLLHAFPLGTNAAQTMLLTALTARPTVLYLPVFDAHEFARLASKHAAESLFVVPAMVTALLDQGALDSCDLTSVLLVATSGAPLPPQTALRLAAALPDAILLNNYTSTESAPAYTSMVFDPAHPTSVGRPPSSADLRVDAALGEVGEVWLRCPTTPRAYYADPGVTAATFRDGWVRMGDVGYLDSDGYLHLVDREADLIKVAGHRVSTLEVEHALLDHPAVADAAVLGLPHPTMGTAIAAAVVLRGADPTSPASLREFLAQRLAAYQLPHRVMSVGELPRNDGGKVVKAQLRELFQETAATSGEMDAGERRLAEIWAAELRVGQVGAEDDFFALGGDSLSASRVAAAASEAFGVEVTPTAVFEAPTVRELARRLPGAVASDDLVSDVDSRVELTSTQESLLAWMYATSEPRDPGPISVGIRIHDRFNADLLRRALDLVVQRHESLRTVFHGTTAAVLEECRPVVTVLSAEHLLPGEREEHVERLLRTDREGHFDLARGPLIRAIVVRLADTEHVLGLAVHHLVFDGASMGVLLHELGLAYSALRTGTQVKLPELALSHRDFVRWTRQRWEVTTPLWRSTLEGAPSHLERFAGRKEAVRLRSDMWEFRVPANEAQALCELAVRHGATPFIALATVWAMLLAHWSESDDLVLMSPVTGRTRPGSESLIGCHSQSLLLRVDTSGDPGFTELLARVRKVALSALDHQHYPFAEFYLRHTGAAWLRVESWSGPAHFPGLESESFELPRALEADWPTPGGEVDRGVPELALVQQLDGSWNGWLLSNYYAFDKATLTGMAATFGEVLARVTREPESALSALLRKES